MTDTTPSAPAQSVDALREEMIGDALEQVSCYRALKGIPYDESHADAIRHAVGFVLEFQEHIRKQSMAVAKIINDNQPGNTAIVEILCEPPTLGVGTLLYAAAPLVTRDVEWLAREIEIILLVRTAATPEQRVTVAQDIAHLCASIFRNDSAVGEITRHMIDAAFDALPPDAIGTMGEGEMGRVLRAALATALAAPPRDDAAAPGAADAKMRAALIWLRRQMVGHPEGTAEAETIEAWVDRIDAALSDPAPSPKAGEPPRDDATVEADGEAGWSPMRKALRAYAKASQGVRCPICNGTGSCDHTVLERLRADAALTVAPPAEGWRTDVENAPKDGTPIEALYGPPDVLRWVEDRYCMLGAPQGAKGPGWQSDENNLPADEPVAWRLAGAPS